MIKKIQEFFVNLYTRFINIDDSPQRIALGFGVGVWLGIFPGTGPLAALAVAFVFKLNKAATLLGGILTNAWLTLVTFVLAAQIGCQLTGMDFEQIQTKAHDLIEHFSWKVFWDVSLTGILKPLFVGYMVVGFLCGLLAYIVVLIVLKIVRREA